MQFKQVKQKFLDEADQWFNWIPVLIGTGMGIYYTLPVEPSIFFILPCLILGGLLAWFPKTRILSWLVAGIAFGIFMAQIRTIQKSHIILSHEYGPAMIEGTIDEIERYENGGRVVLQQVLLENISPDQTPTKIRLRLRQNMHLLDIGDRIKVRGVLNAPGRAVAPGSYDFARDLYFKEIGAVGYTMGAITLIKPDPQTTWGWRDQINQWRDHLNIKIRRMVPGDAGAFVAALITGDRHGLAPDTMEQIRNAGIAHLIAISGMHIGMVAGLVFAVVRMILALVPRVVLYYPTKKWAAVMSGLVAGFYMLLAGATIPTQRAFVKVVLVLLAILLDRTAISMRLVAWAAIIILFIAPESILSPGFHLSFAAVIALVAFYEKSQSMFKNLSHHNQGFGKIIFYAAGLACTGLVAGLATAPYTAFHFHEVAQYGVITNMVAIPLMAVWVMPCLLAVLFTVPFGGGNTAIIWMANGTEQILTLSKTIAAWPHAITQMPHMPLVGIVAISLGGLWVCIWQTRWRWWGVVPIIIGLSVPAFYTAPDIWVQEKGDLVAINHEGKLHFSSLSKEKFVQRMWLERHAQSTPLSWKSLLSCDQQGCVALVKNRTIAFPRTPSAIADDCVNADLVIAPFQISQCKAISIDQKSLQYGGNHFIWITPETIKIQSVQGYIGTRPWTIAHLPGKNE